jgi:hypothetical protein
MHASLLIQKHKIEHGHDDDDDVLPSKNNIFS